MKVRIRTLLRLGISLLACLEMSACAREPVRPADGSIASAASLNRNSSADAGQPAGTTGSGTGGSHSFPSTTAKGATTSVTKAPASAPSTNTKTAAGPTTAESAKDRGPLYFGVYHVNSYRSAVAFERYRNSGYVNCFFLERGTFNREQIAADALKCKEINARYWLSVGEAVFNFYADHTEWREGWKEQLDSIVSLLKKNGAYSHMLGFYFDEPYLWHIEPDWLLSLTRYMRETYDNKRVFVCFSVAEVAPEVYRDPGIRWQADERATRYVTDFAFDYYADYKANFQSYLDIARYMKERIGYAERPDIKIWYIPATMNTGGKQKEPYAVEHLNGMMELLQYEKQPGGLMCYTNLTFSSEEEAYGNVGLDKLLAPGYRDYWPELGRRLGEVGRMVVTNTME